MTVYLVGAGPGDPGLITARGLELLRACDVVVHDRLVSDELVAEAPSDAIRVSREGFEQRELTALLVSLGRRGLSVVRLKGGDPFLFGRGSEEALALAEEDVAFEVIPGVSSLASVPASSGIPITHRGIASQVTVVSGHNLSELDMAALAKATGTLVVFMGFASLDTFAERLIEAGKESKTPVAVISRGTTEDERTVVAPLSEIADAASVLSPPALVVVGDVVGLRESLRTCTREPESLIGRCRG